jgi:hypothetical protein
VVVVGVVLIYVLYRIVACTLCSTKGLKNSEAGEEKGSGKAGSSKSLEL